MRSARYVFSASAAILAHGTILDAHAQEIWTRIDYSWIPVILTAITAISTAIFVILLYRQSKHQIEEQKLTVRPIMMVDPNNKDSIQLIGRGDSPRMKIDIKNVGKIPTGRVRVIILPLDKHDGFMERADALKKYLNEIKTGNLATTKSVRVVPSLRERRKGNIKHGTFENFLIVGKECTEITKAFDELALVINDIKDKDAFNKAGKRRANSLAKINPADWNAFYLTGSKTGDIIETTGPVDWEHFVPWDKEHISKVIGEKEANLVFEHKNRRAEIISKMSPQDREEFDGALQERKEVWDHIPLKTAEEFGQATTNLRRTYRETREIYARTLNLIPPDAPISIEVDLMEGDADLLDSDEAYFGLIMQYDMPGNEKWEFTYNAQWYFKNQWHQDYVLEDLV